MDGRTAEYNDDGKVYLHTIGAYSFHKFPDANIRASEGGLRFILGSSLMHIH
jgi:hypothetical protein